VTADLHDAATLYEVFDADPGPVVALLERLVAHCGLAAPPSVLDVGCGPGRLFSPLRALGWRVVGMEPDAAYRARAARVAAPLGTSVRAGGFNDIEASGEFDLVLGINSSFAHVLTAAERADALRRCRRALRPAGLLVLDLPNMLRILHEYRRPEDREATMDQRLVRLARRHAVDYHAATFTTHETYTVTEPDGERWTFEKNHAYAITTWPDLEHLVRQAGFARLETYTSVTDRAPSRLSGPRLVIVAQVT
jgi:SAM-dependent methyltransferase